MSVPLYKDIEKYSKDILEEEFDYKNVLKIKANGPFGVGVTTATEYKAPSGGKVGKGSLSGKLTTKWADKASGFSVDKLEVKPCGSIAVETSLVGVAPGLKFEFKGDDSYKGDLSLIYKNALVTATADLDLLEFSKFKSSVVTQSGNFVVGATAGVDVPGSKDKVEFKNLDLAFSYAVPKSVFAAIKTAKWFSEFNVSLAYDLAKDFTLSGLYTLSPDSKITCITLGGLYKCNPTTSIKLKANTKGVVAASVKQAIQKSVTAIVAGEVDVAKVSAFKLGVTATIG
jgi:hypothetical protein